MANTLPAWQTDYWKGMALAAEQGKPMAVFIARGDNGYGRVVSDGAIPAEAGRLLRDSFVCVYVNVDTADGKSLAGQMAVTEGLVISSPGGSYQALRYTGTVPGPALTSYLTKFSDPNRKVTTTEVGGRQAVAPAAKPAVTYPASYPAAGYPTTYPAGQPFPAYQQPFLPAGGFYFGGGGGG
jgi:hypothetical protein